MQGLARTMVVNDSMYSVVGIGIHQKISQLKTK